MLERNKIHSMNIRFLNSIIERLYFRIPNNLAIYDQLTHVYNSNWLLKIGYKKYNKKECFVTLIDLNNFKQINDIAGHIFGNATLISISNKLRELYNVDNTIEICRLGGDEFIIFSSIDLSSFLLLSNNDNLLSYGIYKKSKDVNIESAINHADKKMYKFKKNNKKIMKNQDIMRIAEQYK